MESIKRVEVGSLLSPKVLVSPTTPISKVVGILRDQNVYEAFLEYSGRIGMITTRDILKVSNITSEKVSSLAFLVPKLSTRSTIGEAARLMMDYRIRALPVVEGNDFVGEVQATSIIKSMSGSDFSKTKADSIMTSRPISLEMDDLTSKARSLMLRRKIDHIPILNERKLEGVLTSSDIVFNMFQATETIERNMIISEEQRKLEFPVRHILEPRPLTCKPDDNISLILDEMIKQGTTYALVILWEEVQGIITYRDYMKLIAEQLQKSAAPVYIVGLPEDPFEAETVKSKYMKTIDLLRRSFPFIEEAKAVIKTFSEGEKERRRYEVRISIVTPKRVFSYSEEGWELPNVFDSISNKLKKMMLQRRSKRSPIRKEER